VGRALIRRPIATLAPGAHDFGQRQAEHQSSSNVRYLADIDLDALLGAETSLRLAYPVGGELLRARSWSGIARSPTRTKDAWSTLCRGFARIHGRAALGSLEIG
jgi:hypothetical protein